MVGAGAQVFGDVTLQVALDLQGRLSVGQAQPVGDAEDVRVHGDDGRWETRKTCVSTAMTGLS